MPTKLTQKTVLITGATKGIGLAISEYLASQWQVVGIARQPIDNFPGKLFCTDLSDKKATEITLQEIRSQYTIDAVVNNVGMTMPVFRQVHEIDLEELQVLWNMNVRTTAQVTQTFVESMKTQRWGRIINITSRAVSGIKGLGSYASTKSALSGLTKTWALELAECGITVNAVSPGTIDTEMFRQKHPIGSDAEQRMLHATPMKRIGKTSEIAAVVKFLLSEDASFITGQTLCVDGGSSIL